MLEQITDICKRARRAHGMTQLDVANDTGYSVTNISEFERGRNNNALLLSWYFRFFSLNEIYQIRELWRNHENGT